MNLTLNEKWRHFVFGVWFSLFLVSCCFSDEITFIGVEGDGELFHPFQIEEGPDGNIYVSDIHDFTIKTYDPSGNFLKKLAGKGEGPGEMKRMGFFGFSLSGNLLFFTEPFGGHRWITFLNLTGGFIKAHQLNLVGLFGLLKTVMISKNQFICEIHTMNENSVQKNSNFYTYTYPITLVSLDKQGKIKNIIMKQNLISGISMIGNGAEITIPFRPHFLWDILGHEILISNGLDSKIGKFDFQGKKVGEITMKLPDAAEVKKIDIDIWRRDFKKKFVQRDQEWFQKFGGVIDRYKKSIYNRKPIFDKLHVTEEGHILLFKTKKSNEPVSSGWLVDDKGNILLFFNTTCREIKLSKRYLFFRNIDEDENNILGFMKRIGTAKEDINKFLKIYEGK